MTTFAISKVVIAGTSRIGETGFEPAAARPPAGCATRLRHSPWSADDSPAWRIATDPLGRVQPIRHADGD
jgi:hypothetical protein